MTRKNLFVCIVLSFCAFMPVDAQKPRLIPACSESAETSKMIGYGTLRFTLPKDAVVREIKDVDHWRYEIGFGDEKSRVWLIGFNGPNVGDGNVSRDVLSASLKYTRRTWAFENYKVLDTKGKLRNGRYWREFGRFGEVIVYRNAPAEAAAYFDSIIDTVCFIRVK